MYRKIFWTFLAALTALMLTTCVNDIITSLWDEEEPSSPDVPGGPSNYGAMWARTANLAPGPSEFFSVAVDSEGNIYAAGYQGDYRGGGTFDWGNGVTATGGFSRMNALLVKYNAAGEAQWARTPNPAPAESRFYSVAVDSADNIYVAGYLMSNPAEYNFGNGVTAYGLFAASRAGVLVKYNAAGEAQWAATASSPGGFASRASYYTFVAVDSEGNAYVAGNQMYDVAYNYGNGVTATGGAPSNETRVGNNAILVKYNADGVAQWARTTVAPSRQTVFNSVVVDSADNIYALGPGVTDYSEVISVFNFGNGVIHSAPQNEPLSLRVKYNTAGAAQGVMPLRRGFSRFAIDNIGNTYAMLDSGALYIPGYIPGSGAEVDIGNGVTVPNASTGPYYLVKFNPEGMAQWAKFAGVNGANGRGGRDYMSVFLDSAGNIYTAAGGLKKFDAAGEPQWESRISVGVILEYWAACSVVDSAGCLYGVGEQVFGTRDYGNGATAEGAYNSGTPSGSANAVLVKYGQR